MKINLLPVCAIILATTALTSCEDIYEGGEKDLPEVAVQLKAQITPYEKDKPEAFEGNSKVGVYMLASEDGAPIVSNLELPMDDEGVIDTGNSLFYPKDGSKVNIFCYTPYTASASAANTLRLDVATPAAAAVSDYLYSANRKRYMALAPVKVQLKHILSRAEFGITAGEGISDADLAAISFAISDMPVKADFDLFSGEITHGQTGDIAMTVLNGGHNAECSVIACNVPNLVVSCTLKGVSFTKKLGPIDFMQGCVYKFDVVVSEPGFEIVLRQIEDWKVEEY